MKKYRSDKYNLRRETIKPMEMQSYIRKAEISVSYSATVCSISTTFLLQDRTIREVTRSGNDFCFQFLYIFDANALYEKIFKNIHSYQFMFGLSCHYFLFQILFTSSRIDHTTNIWKPSETHWLQTYQFDYVDLFRKISIILPAVDIFLQKVLETSNLVFW